MFIYTAYNMPEEFGGKLKLLSKKYEGYFKKGKFNGQGNYTSTDQIASDITQTLGNYLKNNKRDLTDFMNRYKSAKSPLSPYLFPEAKVSLDYTGEFSKNEYSGKGKQYSNGKLVYNGSFKKQQYNGKGELYYPSGKLKYSGSFKNGKYNGKGTLYNEDGTVKYKGNWRSGDIK